MNEIPIKLLVSPNKEVIDENTIIVVQYSRHEDGGYKVLHCIKLWHSHEYFIFSQTMKLNYSRKIYRSNKIAQTNSNLFLGFVPISRYILASYQIQIWPLKFHLITLLIGGPSLWPILVPPLWMGFFPFTKLTVFFHFSLWQTSNQNLMPQGFPIWNGCLCYIGSGMVFHFTISDLALLY